MSGVVKEILNNTNPYIRPAYSTYEIGKMVSEKRKECTLTKAQLAKKWGMEVKEVELIEAGKRILNTKLFRLVSEFIEKPLDSLMYIHKDDKIIFCRKDEDTNQELTQKSINIANYLFHEMLVQKSLIGD